MTTTRRLEPMMGVVFDCDGVLVNTEELGWEVWRSLASNYGIELTLEDLRAVTGCTDSESVAYFSRWLEPDQLAKLGSQFEASFSAALRDRTEPYADALESIVELRERGVPVAVASNSTIAQVHSSLGRAGLSDLVDFVAGVDQVDAPKPAPGIYRHAAAALNCETVVAVEDSPAGIASAVAAGLPVLAVDRGAFGVEQLNEASLVVPLISYGAIAALGTPPNR
ncbi:MAG: HAD family phosphatase [Acidimicrobiaceae bacterium]|nr:HAD family phosphatase [Acidimicrobiaceae bacterium]